ncbi:hypothetical protein B0O80DRAFT_502226 [Mortierella sp. GBAus27b]|nr:hypothetical protein BGX31_006356 [Mortierella sp. GBA43]KAI8348095.1 hypothetical protein B0O80DRAFT_502226 [Mortierella sp. GBAus27b]
MSQSQSQFHHYIPRFILKTFADNFVMNTFDNMFIADSSRIFKATDVPDAHLACKKKSRKPNKKNGKGNKGGGGRGEKAGSDESRPDEAERQPWRSDYHIKLYHAKDHTTVLTDIARAYGIMDMYKDISSVDSMKFENLLSKLECTSSTFIRKVWAGEHFR